MGNKHLVKNMTMSETQEYLNKHPEYRLPLLKEIQTEDLHWVAGGYTTPEEQTNVLLHTNSYGGNTNVLFKLHVYLISKDK